MLFIDCPWKEIYIIGARKSATVSLLLFPPLPHPLFLKYIHSVPWYRQVSKCHPLERGIFDGAMQNMMDSRKVRAIENSVVQIWTSNILSTWVIVVACLKMSVDSEHVLHFLQLQPSYWVPVMSLGNVMTSSSRSHKICSQVCRQQVHFLSHTTLSLYYQTNAQKSLISQAWDSSPITHRSHLPGLRQQTSHPQVSPSSRGNSPDIAYKFILISMQQIIVPPYRWLNHGLGRFLIHDILVKRT